MIVALTGGIGSGKSYVCRLLAERGIEVYDCDAHAKELMRTSPPLRQQLKELVGDSVFHDGILQKSVLAEFLLRSDRHTQAVNAVIHPAVACDFEQSGLSWLESAILFDSGFDRRTHIDKVDGISREKALEWMARQLPQEDVLRRSDYEIVNDGVCLLAPQVDRLLSLISE